MTKSPVPPERAGGQSVPASAVLPAGGTVSREEQDRRADEARPSSATPREDLERHVMDVNIPKNEAEWWAQSQISELRAVRQQLEEENDRLEDALQQIDSWSRAYPLDIFPEPDFDKAREVLTAAGMTLDAIASSCMRRVVDGVGRVARAALSPNQERLK